ncbi:MAG: acyl-CoA dehydrogenase family protein [Thermodesulfobacteriota bacterium]|nr:acyl-CoA dehydrogenase family protein [Thermodesulfobacteriota bacterium]
MISYEKMSKPADRLSPMEKPFRQVIRKWTEDDVMPYRRQYDEDWKDHHLIEPAMKKLCVDLGIQTVLFPEELGGMGFGSSDYMAGLMFAMCEEMARGDSALALANICSMWALCTFLLKPNINMRLARELAPMFCRTDKLCVCCQAMTEPQGGSDIENIDLLHGKTIRTTATLDGNEWVINGHKLWPTNSGGIANLFGVPCTTNPGSDDPDDFAYIMVPAHLEGVKQSGPYQKAGMAADKNGDIWFDNVRVPDFYRVQGPGKDAEVFKGIVTIGLLGSVGFGMGAMMNVYEILYDFVNTHTIGNRPLKENDAVAGVIGQIAGDIDICRILSYELIRLIDSRTKVGGKPLHSEETIAKARNIKAFVSDVMVNDIGKAMDVLGGYGSDRAMDVEKHWRDVKMIQLWLGGKQLCQAEATRYFFDCETI